MCRASVSGEAHHEWREGSLEGARAVAEAPDRCTRSDGRGDPVCLRGDAWFFVAETALDEAGFKTVSRNMIEDDAIRTQIANTVVDGLYGNVDVEAAIAERLPPVKRDWPRFLLVFRAPARTGGGRRPRAAAGANGLGRRDDRTQRQLVRLLDDKNRSSRPTGEGRARPSSDHDRARRPARRDRQRWPRSFPVRRKITIIEESQLETVQTITKILRAVATGCGSWDCCRRARDLACSRASQARAPRARDRRAYGRAPDAGRTPRCRRLSRRPPRQGRRRQAGGTRRVEPS